VTPRVAAAVAGVPGLTREPWLRRHPLTGFFALTFAWSWTCWLLSPALKAQSSLLATLLMFLGSFGPSLAAVAVVAYGGGRAGLRVWFGRCLQWRVGAGWMALAFFLPLALMSLAAAMHIALGGAIAPSPAAGHVLMAAVNFFLIFLVGGPMGEEFGWRGYALGQLQDRHGWRMASLVLGAVWGVWHLPLFFIDGTSQAHIPLALFLLSVVAMSVLFAWFARHTAGSVVPALVLHTAINAWPSIVPVLPTGESYRPYALVVALLVLVALGLLVQPRFGGPAFSQPKRAP
jgi:membrane protease YdiL (CAAX protease family)